MGPENRRTRPERSSRTVFDHHEMKEDGLPKPFRLIVNHLQANAYPRGLTQNELNKLYAAYTFSLRVHRGQKRENGARYVDHVLRVGIKVASYGGKLNQVITGLLHDSIEQGFYGGNQVSHSLLMNKFGKRVANAVAAMSVAKITSKGRIILPQHPDYHEVQHLDTAENYWRRESDAIRRVLRHGLDALLPKICDQSDNMYTVSGMSPEKWERYYQKSVMRVDLLTGALAVKAANRGSASTAVRTSLLLRPVIENELLDRFSRMKNILADKLGAEKLAELERSHPLRSLTSFSAHPSLPRPGRSR
ncbi:MAG: HD domain-containing protein [Candidatus Micrarchaeota archaeon]